MERLETARSFSQGVCAACPFFFAPVGLGSYWSPRAANQEADELANGFCTSFSPELRLHVESQSSSWGFLPNALEIGRAVETKQMRENWRGEWPKSY